jgi:hypothetical protein
MDSKDTTLLGPSSRSMTPFITLLITELLLEPVLATDLVPESYLQ